MTEQMIYSVEGESQALKEAVSSAQATFKFYWREMSWEARRIIKCLDMAAVKLSFMLDPDDPDIPVVENMWVNDVDFDGETITGVLMNEPRWATEFKAGDLVSLPFAALNDWMYVRGGHVYGGFTVDALRSSMSDDERAGHDAAWGLDFGEPGTVEVAPAAEGHTPWLLSRALSSVADQQLLAQLEQGDHPMAVNMREKIEEALQQYPGMITDFDDGGWLLLHREVLAGNYPVVQALLRHGADPLATNSHGQTSQALAHEAGWPRIARLLQGDASDEPAPAEAKGFSLRPVGLLLIAVALAWLYFLVVVPVNGARAGHAVEVAGQWDFVAAVFVLGFGLFCNNGAGYLKLRQRTPQWGASRALDIGAMLVAVVVAFALHDQVQRYVIGH
ncbi:DUF2314 domain-containing protein [Pseudomonas sp. CC120222-01a]|uniref:DUF2314 domain-containing protein n=1 Tax=Pseudomonas sp. CC120222-01a TaxID=1378075 RepID=UPI000D99CD07|nr:DUF2314 domain-containing protein [Pseudomonas sp. CC120222-01a]PVZ39684.1 uncharacterized protein YegJ (DUF2314 family) [Pseudomonas sp. CC120222-01a]